MGCHFLLQCRKVKSESEVAQSCWTLRDPMDCSLPGSSLHGIFQARVLEWVAIAFSGLRLIIFLSQKTNGSNGRDSIACLIHGGKKIQAHPSMGFFRQEYWSRLPFSPPGDLQESGIKPMSPALTGGFLTTESLLGWEECRETGLLSFSAASSVWYHLLLGNNPHNLARLPIT